MKAILPLLLLPAVAVADNLVSYTGTFAETDHPSIAGAHVVTLTSHGTLTVPSDVRLLRLLVVGGGGGGGFGGGAGGQVIDWTPEEPAFLKSDDRYTAVVGYGGFRITLLNPDDAERARTLERIGSCIRAYIGA